MVVEEGFNGPCPHCGNMIILAVPNDHCPVCWNVPDQAAGPTPTSGAPLLSEAAGADEPERDLLSTLPGFGEGIVRPAPTLVHQEPPDVDALQSLILLALLAGFGVAVLRLSALLFLLLLGGVVLSFALGPPHARAATLRRAVALPYLLLHTIFVHGPALLPGQTLFGRRPVWAYELDLRQGTAARFLIKGRLTPQPIEPGHYVRVWVTARGAEPWLCHGLLRNNITGEWIRLAPAEVSVGVYWLLGLAILLAGLFVLDMIL